MTVSSSKSISMILLAVKYSNRQCHTVFETTTTLECWTIAEGSAIPPGDIHNVPIPSVLTRLLCNIRALRKKNFSTQQKHLEEKESHIQS